MQLRGRLVGSVLAAAVTGATTTALAELDPPAPGAADDFDAGAHDPGADAAPPEPDAAPAVAAEAGRPVAAAQNVSASAEPRANAPSAGSNLSSRAALEIGAYQDSVAVSVLTPSLSARVESPTAGWGATGRYLVDVVSAASPDIVATASPRWVEVRHAGNVGARYKPGDFGVSAGGAVSYTPDYLALGGNAQLTQDLDEKNLTLVEGYGYGHDVIGRTGTPFSVFSRTLDYHAFNLGVSRVVNPSLVLGLFADVVVERGDQSKPYRYIPIFAPGDAERVARGASVDDVANLRIHARPLEQLPLERERGALTGRLAWRLTTTTLRVEERAYADTWGLAATTTDVRYFVDVSRRLTLWPHARVHLQKGVAFWQRAYTSTGLADLPLLRTGDRELGPLSNLGLGGGFRLALGKAGSVDDLVLSTTADGTWTSFADAIYVKDRFSVLVATTLEVGF